MNSQDKISPAFEPFLAESGANDKRDAIVIFKAPMLEGPRVRGGLRELQKRLDYVKARAAAQKPVQEKLFENYQKAGAKRLPTKQHFAVSAIGSSALPSHPMTNTRCLS